MQVALGAGYSSSVAFGRAFERELGVSPGAGSRRSNKPNKNGAASGSPVFMAGQPV